MAREAQSRTCEQLRASSDQLSQSTTHRIAGRGIIPATLLCKEKEILLFPYQCRACCFAASENSLTLSWD